ncbi:MAG: polysaccharide deacetylase family protein [candidate division SR1 bacterium]|nr:polysaccharide deacetylase family protein [candidate division SR1 bacterium]
MVYIKAFSRPNIFFIISFLLIASFSSVSTNVSASNNLISNPSAESGSPTDWSKNGWGTNQPEYTLENDAQDGSKSLKVTVNNYTNGDARWSFKDVTVTPNTQYKFSAYYKSSVPIEVDMDSTFTTGIHDYSWLGDLPTSPDNWTQVSYTFTTSNDSKAINIYFPIFSKGWVQTDNYSLVSDSVVPPPTPLPPPTPVSDGFKRPLISIDFDDGWKNAYKSGFPVLDEFGFKGSAMIVTDTTQNPDRYNNLYMNSTEVVNLSNRGHKIGSHSATHVNLVGLNDGQLQSEVVNPKIYLESLLGQPINYFVTPFCEHNAEVTDYVRQHYTIGMRNCDSNVNIKSSFDQYNVNAFPILNTTTLAELQKTISSIKQNNGWLVLMYHEVKPGNEAYSITQANFRAQMQAIKDSGVVVVPSEDAIIEINGQ